MSAVEKSPVFYGWYIVGIAVLANFMSVGTNFYIFNAVMEPLCEAHGWTRGEVNFSLVIGTFTGFFASVMYGTLVMKTGPRPIMTVGGVVAGISFIALGRAETLPTFYALYISLFLGNAALGGIVANTAVNNWFVRKRGTAMGVATAGVSFSGAVVPLAALFILQATDLRSAFTYIGIALAFTGPVAYLLVRNRPEDYGIGPDGDPIEVAVPRNPDPGLPLPDMPPREEECVWGPGQAVKTGAFWKTGIAFGLVMMGVVGVMSQLKPRFSDVGFDDITAMYMMAATAFLGAMGKYFWGMFCDRFDPRRVAAVLMALNAVGLGLALIQGSLLALILFIVVFGFAMGGVMSTFPINVAYLFGRKSFASVLRFMSLFLVLQLVGYIIAGKSYDLTGSYNWAYFIYIFLDIAGALLIYSVRRPVLDAVSAQ